MSTTQSSVGQQVEAQAVAGAMAGERAYHEIRFPATGDFETELINMVSIFCDRHIRVPYPNQATNERLASVFDYLAKRYRDSAREMDTLKQPTQRDFESEIRRIMEAERQQSKPAWNAPPQSNLTAAQVATIDREMRDEMREKMLSELHKTAIR